MAYSDGKCDDCNRPQIDARGCDAHKPLKWWQFGTYENDHGTQQSGIWICDECWEKRKKDYPLAYKVYNKERR